MGISSTLPALASNAHPHVKINKNTNRQAPTIKSGEAIPRGKQNDQAIERAFEASVYQKQTQTVSLSARFQEIAARLEEGGAEAAAPETDFDARQLSFDFFAESKTETLVTFRQRSDERATELPASRASSFTSVSQTIAARFEFSANISASSLEGFNNLADSLADNESRFGELLNLAEGLLDAADALFNEFFSLFGQNEPAPYSFSNLFQQLRAALFSGEFLGGGDGASTGSTSASLQLSFSFEISGSITIETGGVQQADPIVFDLDGDGIDLTHHTRGAHFDLLGDGKAVNTAFVTGGDAFLALDRNGDGQINSGQELFGEQHGAANGYEELRKFDSNLDGVIDKNDDVYDELLLFRDNGNGKTEDGELITLADAGIASINLDYSEVDRRAAGGNRLAQLATFRRTNGTLGRTADALLNYTV